MLIKDLQEDEEVCTVCNGIGLKIVDNRYGLSDEKSANPFPYKQQSITSCHNCYNGVVNLCPHCKKILGRGSRCDCEGYMEAEADKREAAEDILFMKAEKITYSEYIKRCPENMIYDKDADEFYSELESLIEAYNDEAMAILPKYVYGTSVTSINLDVDNLIDDACEELHEDAKDNIVGYEKLKLAIDEFTKDNESATGTFMPDYSIAIILNPEEE